MSQAPITSPPEASIVAVSVGTDPRWSWRIVTRHGELLRESTDTFASLAEALENGRDHLREIVGLPASDARDAPMNAPRPSGRTS